MTLWTSGLGILNVRLYPVIIDTVESVALRLPHLIKLRGYYKNV